jgi:2-methylcitrate dehydratase
VGARAEETIAALAEWVLGIDGNALPLAATEQAKLLVLDTIGCAIAGSLEPAARAVLAVIDGLAGSPTCTVIGRPGKTDVLNAVLANGVLLRVLDLNDYVIGIAGGQPESGGHPSDNIPVALAIGEARRCPGRDILSTIIVGYELYARLQGLMNRRGDWDGVSVSGLVAAAMAGRLMQLDQLRLAHALALGAARAPAPAAVRSGKLSAAKSLANALVAQSGVQAALLAEQGVTGPLAILNQKRGLGHLFPLGDLVEVLTTPFPEPGAIMRANIKAYPCLATGQSAVAAALELYRRRDGVVSFSRIEARMADYPILRDHLADPHRRHPMSREAADHSFHFAIAAALCDGSFGLAQFAGERWRDPHIIALMDRIEIHTDPAWNLRAPASYPCAIRASDADGEEYLVEVVSPPGFSRNGIAVEAVIEKFHAITAQVVVKPLRERIIDIVTRLDRCSDLADLWTALAAPA